MMKNRCVLMLPVAGLLACASNPAPVDVCAMTLPPTTGWTVHDEGGFTLQLPPDYTRVEVQGIDSQVGGWEAPGRRVSYDLGFYSNPLRPDDPNAFPALVVCQESDGRGTPRIVRYSPAEGGYTVGAHWPDLRTQAPGMTVSMTLEGVVEQEEDQGEILAIIHSVRIEIPEAEVVDTIEAPAAGTQAPLTAEGWGPLRIGMTRAEVVAAAGEDANPNAVGGPEPDVCDQFRPERAPEGMLVMIERGRLTRITLSAGTTIRTERGFGVGDRAAPIEASYRADAEISPHKYAPAPAAYITVWTTAPDAPDARGLVYEIGPDGRVSHIHAGSRSIQYVEGCL